VTCLIYHGDPGAYSAVAANNSAGGLSFKASSLPERLVAMSGMKELKLPIAWLFSDAMAFSSPGDSFRQGVARQTAAVSSPDWLAGQSADAQTVLRDLLMHLPAGKIAPGGESLKSN
jgi:hypothetical protein